jgi:16S rRNA (uracil1498-N3)-methyltransferase
MARLNSFYLAPALWREPFLLEGEELHHLGRVLRAKVGDTLRLFDGQGR